MASPDSKRYLLGPWRLRPLSWRLTFALEWKAEDAWVGAFWKRTDVSGPVLPAIGWDLWVCLLPCLPLHFWWYRVGAPALGAKVGEDCPGCPPGSAFGPGCEQCMKEGE